jgi:hypothetical protein
MTRKRPTYGDNRRPFYGVTTKVFGLGSERSLCDLSVLCFRIADWVSPYLKRSALRTERPRYGDITHSRGRRSVLNKSEPSERRQLLTFFTLNWL